MWSGRRLRRCCQAPVYKHIPHRLDKFAIQLKIWPKIHTFCELSKPLRGRSTKEAYYFDNFEGEEENNDACSLLFMCLNRYIDVWHTKKSTDYIANIMRLCIAWHARCFTMKKRVETGGGEVFFETANKQQEV